MGFKATLDNLLGGVSQQPSHRRLPSQCEEQINMLSDVERGLTRRAPTIHKAVIAASSPEDYDAAFLYTINRDDSERYRVIILGDGTIKVFDLDGSAITVKTPTGTSYLTSGSPTPNLDIRAATIQDTTIIANRKVSVAKAATTSPDLVPQALLYVRDADFSTLYRFTLGTTVLDYRTPDGTDPGDTDELNTQLIASQLKAKITGNSSLNSLYTATLFGSTVHIVRKDSQDFTISVEEGLGGEGLIAIKGGAQKFEDLPPAAPDGYTVQITGDPSTAFDNYWVEYSDLGTIDGRGVWQETVAPDERTDLNASTMPHELVRGGDLLSDLEAIGFPAVAITTNFEGSESSEEWAPTLNGSTETDLTVTAHDADVFANATDANGISATYSVNFNIDCTGLDDEELTLRVSINDGASSTNWTEVATKVFVQGDGVLNDHSILFTTADLDENFDVRVQLDYTSGATPLDVAFVTFKTLTYTPASANKYVDFSAGVDDVYPDGVTVRLVVNSENVDVVLSADSTPVQVAALMTTAVNAESISGITASDLGDGVVKIEHTSSAPTVTSAFPSGFSTATVLITDGLGVDPGELVGDVVENITDGSSMTITSNGTNSITGSGGLSGGSDNTFSDGDACRVVGSGTYFVFRQAQWASRVAGNEETNPFPSFVGREINEVFFHANRLGFCSDENAVLSQADDYFNFFRTTVTDLLDSAPIDVSAMTAQVSKLVNAMHWNGHLILSSDQTDFILTGEPILTPKTARLPVISQYGNSNRVRPFVSGRDIYFAKERSGSTRVMRYTPHPNGRQDDNTAIDITRHVPTYIDGMPLAVVGSSDYEIIAVLASGNQQTVYIYKFYDDESNNQRLQSSWSKWTFPVNATVLGIDIVDDNMGLVVQYHDIVSFEIIPIDSSFTDEELGCITHLDRRVTEDTTGVSAAVDGGVTTWTLPYQVRFIGLYPVFDTFTDEDSTELPAHEPDSAADIGSWDVLEVDTGSGPFDLTVTSNRLRWAAGTSDGRKAFCLRSENALIPTSGEWEQRVAIIRPTFTTGTYGVGVAFYLDPEGDFQESGGSTGDTYDAWPRGVYVILEQVDANNVRPRLLEFDGTDPGVVQDTTDSLDPFALASLATIELGVTVDGSDVTIWTEPSGGGTRTERGTATLMTDFASSGDLHAGVGGYNQSASNPVQTMDNFHMLIPFAGPADGTLVIVNRDTGAIIAALTRDSIGFNQVQATGDFTSTDVFIGLDSEGSIQFSRQHRREGPNVRTDGRLQLKYWEVDFEDTAAFDAVVDYLTVGGHSDKTYPFDYSATDPCGTSGIHRFPVLSRNDKATVTLRTTDHRPCTFQRAHWEAEYYRRIRRG